MTILYSVISRGITILTKYASCTGNFQEVTEQILKQISPEDSKLTYSHDNYLFHYISENGIIYMCITDDEFERSRAFLFLNEIKNKFNSMFGTKAQTAIAYSLDSEFSRVLANQMKYYSNNRNLDTISKVHGELDELKKIMVKNIDSVATRGERLELLINKTENLTSTSVSFRQTSRNLSRALFWKNVKCYLLIGAIAVVVLYLLMSLACGGFAWKSCVG
ncbi:vAMP-7, putative [Pediculus humanus corporis]|uniref:Vesicle-associated membrane protein 7 n=1 Tax=Pediculus humanus subsp. corporis TaxID=121224 RepID=E0VXM7_PEDHC|nr:vAMP-7, putative [Pediculus humanus corporis]EEB18133.1 vAMP-7, putative [Pediculus humanus corporis]